jgi:hypothetical protein
MSPRTPHSLLVNEAGQAGARANSSVRVNVKNVIITVVPIRLNQTNGHADTPTSFQCCLGPVSYLVPYS